jgi:hypothetical protein
MSLNEEKEGELGYLMKREGKTNQDCLWQKIWANYVVYWSILFLLYV